MNETIDGTQVWTDAGGASYISARDLKRVYPDRPTVEQVRKAPGHQDPAACG